MRDFPKFEKPIENKIWISETFYSIQGEGKYIGAPSIFLRTQGCVLNCIWCDTYNVWKSGKLYDFEELKKYWYNNNWMKPNIHLVITGGEPLARQDEISSFLEYLIESPNLSFEYFNKIEVETSGTVLPKESFLSRIEPHYNVSPKLKNSSMEIERRVRNSLKYFSDLSWETNPDFSSSIFKFVVKTKEDVKEAIETYIKPFEINPISIYLMPECITREELEEMEPKIVELAKEYGFNYSTRLHLHIWNKATGV